MSLCQDFLWFVHSRTHNSACSMFQALVIVFIKILSRLYGSYKDLSQHVFQTPNISLIIRMHPKDEETYVRVSLHPYHVCKPIRYVLLLWLFVSFLWNGGFVFIFVQISHWRLLEHFLLALLEDIWGHVLLALIILH